MSIFQCEKCGCAENTATGWYHYTSNAGDEFDKPLCSACAPMIYKDGSHTRHNGKWHGKFARIFYPLGSMETDENGNLRKK